MITSRAGNLNCAGAAWRPQRSEQDPSRPARVRADEVSRRDAEDAEGKGALRRALAEGSDQSLEHQPNKTQRPLRLCGFLLLKLFDARVSVRRAPTPARLYCSIASPAAGAGISLASTCLSATTRPRSVNVSSLPCETTPSICKSPNTKRRFSRQKSGRSDV